MTWTPLGERIAHHDRVLYANRLGSETGGRGSSDVGATRTGIIGLFANGPLIAAVVSFLIAQVAKVFTHYHEREEWDWSRLVGSGGMPSSHTAFVVGLATAVAVKEGTGSSLFAMCVVFSLVVAYDACGVRLHAGRQAAVLNLMVSELPSDHPLADHGKLRDTLGHTPVQVAVGAVVGIMGGYIVQRLYQIA